MKATAAGRAALQAIFLYSSKSAATPGFGAKARQFMLMFRFPTWTQSWDQVCRWEISTHCLPGVFSHACQALEYTHPLPCSPASCTFNLWWWNKEEDYMGIHPRGTTNSFVELNKLVKKLADRGPIACTYTAVLQVPTVDGNVDLRIPPGTQPGVTLLMGKRGVPKLGAGSNSRGDQQVRAPAATVILIFRPHMEDFLSLESKGEASPGIDTVDSPPCSAIFSWRTFLWSASSESTSLELLP